MTRATDGAPYRRFGRLLAPLFLLVLLTQPAAGEPLDLAIERLARTNGFAVEGLERLRGQHAREVRGDAAGQIETLLSDFNYAIERGADGRISRVSVLGRKRAVVPPRDQATVATVRHGRHHVVEATVRGNAPGTLVLPLLLDTGASTVVLPSSMMTQLGFRAAELPLARMQTANKTVEGRIGVLRSVTVGGMAVNDVRVAFIDDALLNGVMLLGMSYLERFRLTIDDNNDQIVLTRTR